MLRRHLLDKSKKGGGKEGGKKNSFSTQNPLYYISSQFSVSSSVNGFSMRGLQMGGEKKGLLWPGPKPDNQR